MDLMDCGREQQVWSSETWQYPLLPLLLLADPGDLAEDYLSLKKLAHELARLYSQAIDRPFNLYDVEHLLRFKGGNPYSKPPTDGHALLPAHI